MKLLRSVGGCLSFVSTRESGKAQISEKQQGELTTLEIPRGSAISFRLEKDLTFDPAFLRHKDFLEQRLRAFGPNIVHVTGPSEPGILGRGWQSI